MVEHTFLLKEGLWRSEGEFLDGAGKRTAVAGEAHIRHHPDKWVYEGVLRAATVPPTRAPHVYEIQPMAPGNFATPWSSKSAAFGTLHGRFIVVGMRSCPPTNRPPAATAARTRSSGATSATTAPAARCSTVPRSSLPGASS
jgi:hypothetical protein